MPRHELNAFSETLKVEAGSDLVEFEVARVLDSKALWS